MARATTADVLSELAEHMEELAGDVQEIKTALAVGAVHEAATAHAVSGLQTKIEEQRLQIVEIRLATAPRDGALAKLLANPPALAAVGTLIVAVIAALSGSGAVGISKLFEPTPVVEAHDATP